MKKLLVLLPFMLGFISLIAQEKSTIIIGKTIIKQASIVDVHIINQSTKIGTISNNNGFFEIPVKVGDSLYFSHINLQDKFILVTEKLLSNKISIVQLDEKTETLTGFVLEKPKSIFYQDPDITVYKGPLLNAETLKLPYANTIAKEDKSIVKFSSGTTISLDNLINSLNGNNRREKQLNKMSEEDTQLAKIRKQYTDDFFITDLKIQKEYINQFLNDCIDKNIIRIFKSDNVLRLTKLLIEESRLYPKKTVNENSLLSNH